MPPSARQQRGVTLTELVMVMTIAGVLSAVAAIRMFDRSVADARGFADRIAATLQFAQKAAVAQRRLVYVNVDAAGARLRACLDSAAECAQPLAAAGGGALDISGAAGVTLASGATQFSFDGLGRPSLATALTLTAAGGGSSFSVTVEPDTGYVRRAYP
jgi:MSHA pilin protein MshC